MRAKKADVNEFLAWLTSGKVRSFRILPHQPGEDITIRWVSSLNPENEDDVTHLSRTGDNLVELLSWIPTYEKNFFNDTEDKAPEFIHAGKKINELSVREFKQMKVPNEKNSRFGNREFSDREDTDYEIPNFGSLGIVPSAE